MRAVNLLPRDNANRGVASKNLPAVVGAGVGVLVVAALSAGYLSASSKVAAAQKSLDQAKAQLAATPLPPPTTTPVNTTPAAVADEQAPRLQAVSTVLSQRIAWDRILREFSLVLPSDVWIQSLSLTTPVAGTASGFSITGTTYSYDSVARLLSRVNLVPDLTQVQLQSVGGEGRLVTFVLQAGVKGAAAPAAAPVAPPAAPSTDTTSTTGGTPSS